MKSELTFLSCFGRTYDFSWQRIKELRLKQYFLTGKWYVEMEIDGEKTQRSCSFSTKPEAIEVIQELMKKAPCVP